MLDPRFRSRKTLVAVVRLGASKAWSLIARLTTTVMIQNISLLVPVKKKMVLCSVSGKSGGQEKQGATDGLGLRSTPL